MVRMRRSNLRQAFDGVDWRLSTADSLAAPSAGFLGTGLSGPARRWSLDLAAVMGDVPISYQAVVGWPYLQPERPGAWDTAALDRCDRRLDQMLERGITPGLTLLHIDMP